MIALVATAGPLQPVTDPQPLLKDLQQKMSSLESVSMDFTQERQLKLFNEPLKSEGVMLIQRPDQIRWETTEPYQSILLGNHQSVAQFERNDDKWEKLKLGFPQMLKRVMDQMSLMHQGKIDALTADYTVTVAKGDEVVMTLVPKDQTVHSFLASLEIHLLPDMSATREVVMNEPGGDLTRIIFHQGTSQREIPRGHVRPNQAAGDWRSQNRHWRCALTFSRALGNSESSS